MQINLASFSPHLCSVVAQFGKFHQVFPRIRNRFRHPNDFQARHPQLCSPARTGQTAVRTCDYPRKTQKRSRVKASWWMMSRQIHRSSCRPEFLLWWRGGLETNQHPMVQEMDFSLPVAYAWDRSTAANYCDEHRDSGARNVSCQK
jgi:hypothetical protein